MKIPICITNNYDDINFMYLIECISEDTYWDSIYYILNSSICSIKGEYKTSDQNSFLWGTNNSDGVLYKNRGYYQWYTSNIEEIEQENIPTSRIRIYFPEYSLSKKESSIKKYIFSVCTKLNGIEIELGNFEIIPVRDLQACTPFKEKDNKYFEYADFLIINPEWLALSSNAKDIRTTLTGSSNTSIYNLYFLLHPIKESSSSTIIVYDSYIGGQATYTPQIENIKYILNKYPLQAVLSYNSDYNNSIIEAIKNSFNITVDSISCSLVIANVTIDEGEDYVFLKSIDSSSYTEKDNSLIYSFSDIDIDWDLYECGKTIIIGIFKIYYDDSYLELRTNSLPITPELFSIYNSSNDILLEDEIESITTMSIRIYNKLEVTTAGSPSISSSDSGIIQPIFYKVQDAASIIIHPEVSELISINLNSYKSKVTSFILQVEGITFTEYARTSSGIIFKIVGSKLPAEVSEGTYYILNEDSELVTTGTFKYVY